MNRKAAHFVACVIAVAAPGGRAGADVADVAVDAMFGDHMVLQREMPVAVWGTAAGGEAVTVAFGDQKKWARAGKDGKWLIRLDPLRVGRPGTMTVRGEAGEPIVFEDARRRALSEPADPG